MQVTIYLCFKPHPTVFLMVLCNLAMGSRKMVPPTKPHFFRPFLPGSERQLLIPVSFFKHLKGQDCDKVVLRNANGKLWHVKMVGRKLQDGWKEFASEHDLQVGDFLVFRHEGDMLFDVMAFDKSTCEREYPSTTLSPVEVKVANETLDPSQVDVKVENEILDQVGTEEECARDSVKKTKVIRTFQGKAESPVLKNPHFVVNVRSCSVIRSQMPIPMKFAKENRLSKACCEILLVNQQGKSWTAKLNYNSRQRQTYIGGGWSSFRSGNNLNHGLQKAKKEPNPTRKNLPICDIKAASSSIRNPYFIATVNMSTGKKYQLVVPRQFAKMNGLFRKRCNIILEDERGKPWPMSLRPSLDRLNIGNGWYNFTKAKGLDTGDRVILELVKNREKPVMKFHGITEVKLENTADA